MHTSKKLMLSIVLGISACVHAALPNTVAPSATESRFSPRDAINKAHNTRPENKLKAEISSDNQKSSIALKKSKHLVKKLWFGARAYKALVAAHHLYDGLLDIVRANKGELLFQNIVKYGFPSLSDATMLSLLLPDLTAEWHGDALHKQDTLDQKPSFTATAAFQSILKIIGIMTKYGLLKNLQHKARIVDCETGAVIPNFYCDYHEPAMEMSDICLLGHSLYKDARRYLSTRKHTSITQEPTSNTHHGSKNHEEAKPVSSHRA